MSVHSVSYAVSAEEADRHFLVGNWKKAVEGYGSQYATGSLTADQLRQYAEANIYLRDLKGARDVIKAMTSRGDDRSHALQLLALSAEGASKEAEEKMAVIMAEKGENGYFATVHCAIWSMIDALRAVDYCRKASDIDGSFQAWFLLGQNYEELERFEESTKAYRNAVRINPLSALAHNNLGYSYKERHFYRYAIDEYSKAIDLMPDRAGFYYNIGNAFTHEEAIDLAFNAYKKAVELEPDFAKAHYNLARTYLRKDMIQEAIAEFHLYLKFAGKAVLASVAGRKAVEDEIEQLELYLLRHPSMRSQERNENR